MSESRLTRADVTLGKRNKFGFPFLFRIRRQQITVDGATYGVYTSKLPSHRETEVLAENPPLVKLTVDDVDAGIDALLDVLNARRAEQD
jgi:hypothetical protein